MAVAAWCTSSPANARRNPDNDFSQKATAFSWEKTDKADELRKSAKLKREAFLELPYFDHMHRYLPALMQRAGWKTVSVPVNHRHRTAGVSKYNNLGRALVGIKDLFGVSWLIQRSRRTAVEELPAEHTSR